MSGERHLRPVAATDDRVRLAQRLLRSTTIWVDPMSFRPFTSESYAQNDRPEAWRDMRVTSITDIILMKLLRVKQIEDNQGKTLVSEGVKANYQDMINYAVFAMILSNGLTV